MEDIFVPSAVGAIATVTSLQALNAMAVGEIIAVGDGRKVIGIGSVAADLADVKDIQFIQKTGDDKFKYSVSILRPSVTNLTRADYSAPQNKVITLGGTTEPLSFDIPTTGEANITVSNLSYNHTIATQRVNVSIVKLASEAPEQFVDRLVIKLNSAKNNFPKFFTAAKVVSGAYLGITITASNENVDLDTNMGGIFEGASKRVTTEAKVSLGKGSDVVAMEIDYSRNKGNSGYEKLTDLWYKGQFFAVSNLNYNTFQLHWNGIADRSISKSTVVAKNTLAIAVATGITITPFVTWLALIFGNTYTVAGGFETGTQSDNNPIDQTQS